MAAVQDGDGISEEDEQTARWRDLFARSEAKIDLIFGRKRKRDEYESEKKDAPAVDKAIEESAPAPSQGPAPKKPARTIDEDDYDDDDDEDENEGEDASPTKTKPAGPLLSPSKSGSSPVQPEPLNKHTGSGTEKVEESPEKSEDAESIRKRLEEAKKATEDAVKRSFSTMIYTLEHDRIAMLEQQRLEDSEKQIDADLDHGPNAAGAGEAHGSLSTANLGASSLTLKHLIARIDIKRDRVKASDIELRNLMNEVRKNRSKWANEDHVGQEELYESAEKVLNELKAMTEYSAPFLTRVNKREAPDYYNSAYHI